jgi:hypothetical protein
MEDTISYNFFLESPYKCTKHTTYFHVYDELFGKYRGKKITFVEIGVLGGGSLFLWREFFGSKARIIGIDLNPIAKKWEEKGFEIFIGSQSDENFWKNFTDQVKEIDIVLDDGGHTYEQQIITTECLLPFVKDGGLLVVEDTHTSYMKKNFGFQKYSFIAYVKKLIDRINFRFGGFNSKITENRIWSIQVYESIVAFHINRKATFTSASIENRGAGNSDDFRLKDNLALNLFDELEIKYPFLKLIPGINSLKRKSIRYTTKISNFFHTKKFFE